MISLVLGSRPTTRDPLGKSPAPIGIVKQSTLVSSPRIKYEGEDTSPTTDRELKAWYAYPIAAEVFAVVAVGTS